MDYSFIYSLSLEEICIVKKEIKHIAFIADGNRRWAKAKGLPSLEGHRVGYQKMKDVAKWCFDQGVDHVSLFAFSTENWNRSEKEVGYLMDLLLFALTKEMSFYHKNKIRLKVVGTRERLSQKIVDAIHAAEVDTAEYQNGQINFCVNYGGRLEILEGVKKLMLSGQDPNEITEEVFAGSIWTAGIPDPDIIVRTSGEKRLSGFLAWSGVYSEFFFLKKYWPDLEEEDVVAIKEEYHARDRRFGA